MKDTLTKYERVALIYVRIPKLFTPSVIAASSSLNSSDGVLLSLLSSSSRSKPCVDVDVDIVVLLLLLDLALDAVARATNHN